MSKKSVLLVDDSKTALMMEKMILSKGGYDVSLVMNGEDAVTMAVEQPPDLILLDIIMPGMDGFEVCKRLREGDATRSIPVIMVTTRGEEENIATAYRNGCDEYVTKPIDFQELTSKVKRLLGEA